MICPICFAEMTKDDLLVLDWHEPRQWWVTRHYKRIPEGNTMSVDMKNHNGTWHTWCGQAHLQNVVSL